MSDHEEREPLEPQVKHEPVSVRMLVESAYGWANGDVPDGRMLTADECSAYPEDMGDNLGRFLVGETGTDEAWSGDDTPDEDSPEHWAQAIERMRQVVKECMSVLEALEAYSPRAVVVMPGSEFVFTNPTVTIDADLARWMCQLVAELEALTHRPENAETADMRAVRVKRLALCSMALREPLKMVPFERD